MRDRNPLSEPSRAQLLARLQAVDDNLFGKAVIRLEQSAHGFEQASLRSRVDIEQDVSGRQQRRDLAHLPCVGFPDRQLLDGGRVSSTQRPERGGRRG